MEEHIPGFTEFINGVTKDYLYHSATREKIVVDGFITKIIIRGTIAGIYTIQYDTSLYTFNGNRYYIQPSSGTYVNSPITVSGPANATIEVDIYYHQF